MDTQRIAAHMGSALPSLVRWGLSPDADLVYRTIVSLDAAREGQLAHELGMAHERVRSAVRELADAGAIRRISSIPRHAPKATGRAVWAACQPNQFVRQLHVRAHPVPLVQPLVSTPQPVPPGASLAAPVPGDDITGALRETSRSSPDSQPVAGRPVGRQRQTVERQPAAGPGDDGPRLALTARERAIVELLAQGHTDETAARALALSRRTVGYALGGLMSRLGVDNRFQLGLALGALRAATPRPRTPPDVS
jgi:DNA-binding CsgD family transcriptional regulator/DNA-binding Lrp family transcriptional regulator